MTQFERDQAEAQAIHDRLLWEVRMMEIQARAPRKPRPEAEQDREMFSYMAKLMLSAWVLTGLLFFGLHQLFNYLAL